MLRIGEFGAQHDAGGAGINPVIDRGQHPIFPPAVGFNLRQPRLLQRADIGMLPGFTVKGGFI